MNIHAVGKNGKTFRPRFFPRWLRLSVLVIMAAIASMAAVTQINLTTQVSGILPVGNGGTGQSSFSAGLVRSSGSALSSAELSGDVTTSGSNATTAAKVNGTSIPTNSAADQVIVTTASATGSWASVPNCTGALTYSTSTHLFSCGAALSGTFSDNETPTGSLPGTSLTLAHSPSPAASLNLYYNGQLLVSGGADYTLSGSGITLAATAPSGTIFRASYRY